MKRLVLMIISAVICGIVFTDCSKKEQNIEKIDPLIGKISGNGLTKPFYIVATHSSVQPNQAVVVEGVEEVYYTVRIGDTFSSISRNLGVSIDQIRQLNSLESNSRLVIGQKLIVPQQSETSIQPSQAVVVERVHYTVQIGDTFSSISHKLGVSVEQIRQLNSLESNSRLVIGQKLKYITTDRLNFF